MTRTISEKINDFAIAHYPLLDKDKFIDAQHALCNSACHFNSVQAVKSGRADKSLLVWAGGKNGVVHFINSKGGKYFDETWEGATPFSDYRLIREIKSHELSGVYDILCSTKKAYIDMFGLSFKERRKLKKDGIHTLI